MQHSITNTKGLDFEICQLDTSQGSLHLGEGMLFDTAMCMLNWVFSNCEIVILVP